MRITILIIAALLLAGCAHQAVNEFKTYSESQKPKAESGEMLWSDYYKTLYSIAAKANGVANQADAMSIMNTMIDASLYYEAGTITKQDFDSIQRAAEVDLANSRQYHESKARAAWGEALRRYGETAYRPIPRQSVNCTTYNVGNTVQTNCY